MNILVTGGAGFIGSNFVSYLIRSSLRQFDNISIIDNLTYAGSLTNLEHLPENSYKFSQIDIRDKVKVKKALKGIDVVVNFAAESHVDRSINSSNIFVETNVLGTHTLLEASLETSVSTFLQVSTDEVYGSIAKGSWNEDSILLPNSPYSASKASADLIARSFHKTHEFDVRISRCSNNYGPYQFPEKFIPLIITRLLSGRKVPIYGTGSNVRDWLYVEDHCAGILSIINNGKPGNIYNLGGGTEVTNLELVKFLLDYFEKDESSLDFVEDRKGHDFRYSLSYEKAKIELGYVPQTEFNAGMVRTIEWYLSNSDWWKTKI